MAVGNGRQCGGGYQVTPNAVLNDGLLDVVVVHDVEIQQFGLVLNELLDLTAPSNQFVSYEQISSFSLESSTRLQLNLDGEPYRATTYHFKFLPKALPFVLGAEAPVRTGGEE